ncbi:glycosyltransferase family 2 protein [Lactococcus termiticola]|uniref:Glycosyl transferase n=1 Tax=Lactococcus termiticola TaxID=2169526 RepID=A0A2R5HEU6_9LACT|nr:glycosyltransferase family 2 protein [Lactococcus termiticola]GBG96552.1 glycosyl transferase [Lactococcus termiticola]
MARPKISIVVACYNHEAYIEQCLRSIFEQSYQEIELIVFDDGSTDASKTVIEKVLADSPFEQTQFSSASNQGLAYMRNQGLERATGDYLLYVDSDNFLSKDHVEKLLGYLDNQPFDIAYCQLWDFEGQKNVLREDMDFSLEKEFEGNLIDASALVRKSAIGDETFDLQLNNKPLEDYDFWLRLILNNGARPVFAENTKLNYRLLNSSMTERGNWGRYYESYCYVLGKHVNKAPGDVIRGLQKNLSELALSYDKAEAERLMLREIEATHNQAISDFQAEVAVLKGQLAEEGQKILDLRADVSQLREQKSELEEELGLIKASRSYRLMEKLRQFRKGKS